MSTPPGALLGVDVGTGSVRAGLFSAGGVLLGRGEQTIEIWRPAPDHVEQSSNDIWSAVCAAARGAREQAGVTAEMVAGIGFDATCSLVALDDGGAPVAVNLDGDDNRNVIVWMDHRAIEDAAAIDATEHPVLRFVGGSVSPEMQTPKLRWVKRHLPDTWRRAARWFDLADYLTFRATGADDRSLCTIVCKWTYLGHERRWDESFFRAAGIDELCRDGFAAIGARVRGPGELIGGLGAAAAQDLGLRPGTPVGASLIDAHAGALGTLGAAHESILVDRRLAIIAGTSACHLAVSTKRFDVDGVWGPYWEALLPDHWLTEAGISASGSFLDHVLRSHPAARGMQNGIFGLLDARLRAMAPDPAAATRLTADLHLQPNVLGNRAPLADPGLTGGVSGWRLRDDPDDLARWYLAALQALAYATRHIVDALKDAGKPIDVLTVCGGSATNAWWLKSHADALGMPVAVPAEPDAVLLGSAMLGATAAGIHPSLEAAMAAMTRAGSQVLPDPRVTAYHTAKYRVYRKMIDDQAGYAKLMATATRVN